MVRKAFDLTLKKSYLDYRLGKKNKRTLGVREKQILYHRAKKKCEGCHKKIDFSDMQVGHKKAASKGGQATLSNSVCLCYTCNKLQGTDSWASFVKKRFGRTNHKTVTSSKRAKTKRAKTKPKDSLGLFLPNRSKTSWF